MALDDLLAVIGILPEEKIVTPWRRPGRPAKSGSTKTTPKVKRVKKAKRGAVSASIRAFLASKGKTGARVKDIAAATGHKPANVTAFFYAPANRKAFKKVAPATFAAVGKEG
jgi:hypothetical protein